MPKLFYTSNAAKAEIAELEGQIAVMETTANEASLEINKLTDALATANESILTITAERDASQADLTAANAELDRIQVDLAKATEAVADFDLKVETAVLAKFASLGGPPIAASEKEDKETAITREAFNAMTPRDRTEFSKAGGQIK